jgi:spore coat protein H
MCVAAACDSDPRVETNLTPDAEQSGTRSPQPLYHLPPLQTELQTYELEIPAAALKAFAEDVRAPEQPATFVYGGQRYPVNVRLRGASARTFPKKSWNVDFEDLRFEGREEVNLVSEYQDQTLLVEKLAYDLLEAAQVPAPRTKYVRLVLNGQYQGVYLDIEEVDKKFIKQHELPDDDASIYRCGWWDCEMKVGKLPYQGPWEKQTNETESRADLDALLTLINHTPEPEFPSRLEKIFELDRFLRTMAIDAIISNNFIEDSRSYYISDRKTGRWYYVPWDLNNSDARFWPTYGLETSPIFDHPLWAFTLTDPWIDKRVEIRSETYADYQPAFCNLRTRILLNPDLRERLLAYTDEARAKLLDPAVLHARVDQMYALIESHAKADPYLNQEAFRRGKQFVKGFITKRYAFVKSEIDRLRGQKHGLVIERFNPALGWVELANRGGAPVSLSGMVVTTYLRNGLAPRNAPEISLAPGSRIRLTAAQLGISFPPQGEIGLFNGVGYSGAIDALFYGPLAPGKYYARSPSGAWTIAP